MEPDYLPCSHNARPVKALVGRAQLRIDQAVLEDKAGDSGYARGGEHH